MQAIIIAFSFGALLEALAGFGTPVAFGAIAVPITTLATVTGLPVDDLGAMVGRQTSILSVFVPLALVFIVDGRRGLRQTWAPALVCGVTFGVFQYLSSNFWSVPLSDIIASPASALAVPAFTRVWHAGEGHVESEAADSTAESDVDGSGGVQAGTPRRRPARSGRRERRGRRHRGGDPGPHRVGYRRAGHPDGGVPRVRVVPDDHRGVRARDAGAGDHRQAAGQAGPDTLGVLVAGAGGAFAFLSPILGWLGVAVTGSDTSSNSLFGALQVTAAGQAGLSATLMAAANSSGGVLGKMISPQNLAVAASAVGMQGKEGVLFRRVIAWSLVFLLGMCVLVFLQSTPVLSWMVVTL